MPSLTSTVMVWISIHALREEGDDVGLLLAAGRGGISIHALREEGDTRPTARAAARSRNFYPRPPRGGRRHEGRQLLTAVTISIHALREEGDLRRVGEDHPHNISIHALREEGDSKPKRHTADTCNFYPRPPRGGRPLMALPSLSRMAYFYPRPPRGGRQQKQRQNLYFLINYTTFCTNLEEP